MLISQILNMIENLLAFHDAELLDRFVTLQVTSQVLLLSMDINRLFHFLLSLYCLLTHLFSS